MPAGAAPGRRWLPAHRARAADRAPAGMPRASFGRRPGGQEGSEGPSAAGPGRWPRPASVAGTASHLMRTSGATLPGPAGDPARVDRSNGPAAAPDGERCVAPDRSVFRHSLGPPTDSRRSPHEPRYPTSVPSAGDPAGRGAEGSLATVLRRVNGFIHELADSRQGCGQGPSLRGVDVDSEQQARSSAGSAPQSAAARGLRTGRPRLRRTTSMTSSV
jgi:hypothetical protein